MDSVTKDRLERVIRLCDDHKVKRLYAFGSFLTERFVSGKSDIDLLVEMHSMSPIDRGEHLIQLWDDLEQIFQNKVDLITEESIRNPFFRTTVEQTKRLIYDRSKQEIFV